VRSRLANQTIARLQHARRAREALSVPEVIKLIEDLSGRAFSISVQELADLISRDTLVTVKVIQAANTFGYNPFGLTVTTVSQAIHVVGFNKIRNLALSMLLLDNAALTTHSEAQCESAALSLCSGIFAQTLAAQNSEQEPEQAFVFACMRHYGRLLLTTFLAPDFKAVHDRPPCESEAEACRRVFGLTALELTQHLFEEVNLPRPILRCLEDLTPSQLATPASSNQDELTAIAQFCAAFSELVLSPRVGSDAFAGQAEHLRATFEKRVPMGSASTANLLQAVDENLKVFARAYGPNALSNGVLKRLAARVAHSDLRLSSPSDVRPGTTDSSGVGDAGGDENGRVPGVDAAFDDGSAGLRMLVGSPAAAACGVESSLASDPLTHCLIQLAGLLAASRIDLKAIESLVVRCISRGLCLRDCLLCVRDADANRFAMRAGVGELALGSRTDWVVDADRRDIFGIAVSRGDDVLIQDTSESKLRRYLPDWLVDGGRVTSFVLLPLRNEQGTLGLILGTRSGGPALAPAQRELQMLRAIRHHLLTAWRISMGSNLKN
jgi:HD-like signal output (HDOD) protein